MLRGGGDTLVVLEVVVARSGDGSGRSDGADAGLGFRSASGGCWLNVVDGGCELIPVQVEEVDVC